MLYLPLHTPLYEVVRWEVVMQKAATSTCKLIGNMYNLRLLKDNYSQARLLSNHWVSTTNISIAIWY